MSARPCPFCHSKRQSHSYRTGERSGFYVLCLDCGAEGPKKPTRGEAVSAWKNSLCRKENTQLPVIKVCRVCGCAFSEAIDVYLTNGERKFMVLCPSCNNFGGMADTKGGAIKLWNGGKQ